MAQSSRCSPCIAMPVAIAVAVSMAMTPNLTSGHVALADGAARKDAPPSDEPAATSPEAPGGVIGASVDPEQAREAEADLEGSPAPSGGDDAPQRMRPLQAGAWWTLFSTVVLGTTAGTLAGLAEVQEDRALRIAREYDPERGMQPFYEERQSDYEEALDRGQALQWASWGVLAAGVALAVVSGSLFIAHGQRRHRDRHRAHISPGALEVRF